jgi:energy-coupling factor transporter ATP-binding protein EcfA2
MRPRVLVLDEPTAQLDPLGSREVFTAIRRLVESEKMTVVIAEHKLEWLAVFADRILALDEGRLAGDGSPAQVLTDDALAALGMGQTRYTLAARRARQSGDWPQSHRLAVTLEEAVQGFQARA